jgi:hypothetical protein
MAEIDRLILSKGEYALEDVVPLLVGNPHSWRKPDNDPDVRATTLGAIAGLLSGELAPDRSGAPDYMFRGKFIAVATLAEALANERDSKTITSMCLHVNLLSEKRLEHAQLLVPALGKLLERDGLSYGHSSSVCSSLENILTRTADPKKIEEIESIVGKTQAVVSNHHKCEAFGGLLKRLDEVQRAISGGF